MSFDFDARFIFAAVLSFPAAALSSSLGLGGGTLYIPILSLVAGLELKTAVSFSALMVTGGSIGSVICQLSDNGHKSSIDIEIVLLSEPCMLLGVSIGVICNAMFPEWLVTILLVIFFSYNTYKTCLYGIKLWMEESRDHETCENALTQPSGDHGIGIKSKTPWVKIGTLVTIWLSFFALSLLRGNRYGKGILHIRACGTLYWSLFGSQILLALVFTFIILFISKSSKERGNRGEYGLVTMNPMAIPAVALVAGVVGGLFGIGGGTIVNPIFLQLGLNPRVTVATSSVMVLFSSSMSAIQYLISGMEDVRKAGVYAGISFIASLLGFFVIKRAITKSGRISVAVLLISLIIGLSAVFMAVYEGIDIWRNGHLNGHLNFKKLC